VSMMSHGGDPVIAVDLADLGEEGGKPGELDKKNGKSGGEEFFELMALENEDEDAVGGENKPGVVVGVDGDGAD